MKMILNFDILKIHLLVQYLGLLALMSDAPP